MRFKLNFWSDRDDVRGDHDGDDHVRDVHDDGHDDVRGRIKSDDGVNPLSANQSLYQRSMCSSH